MKIHGHMLIFLKYIYSFVIFEMKLLMHDFLY